MRDGVPPRRQPAVGPQKLAVPRLELNGALVFDRLPLDGAVEAFGERLQHLPAGHPEEEGVVGGGEVLAVAALEADDVVGVGDEFDGPFGGFGGAVAVLGHGLLVFLGRQVLVVGVLQPDGFSLVEELHGCCLFASWD